MKIETPALGKLIRRTIIVAYREDTTELEQAFAREGLSPEVQRPTYSETENTYSRTIRCLLNHLAAWRKATAADGYSCIVEADFVPCRGLSSLPAPFDPVRQGPLAWAFLYAGGPRFLGLEPGPCFRGHAACPVAILVSPAVAERLVQFAEKYLRETTDLTGYSLWDTIFQWHLVGMGARCYMPWRHYGEHGGMPNPEHGAAGGGLVARMGVLRNHHAECLMAPLAFLPPYAQGSRSRFWRTRLLAKLVGFGRACTGRVVALENSPSWSVRLRAHGYAFRRLLSLP